MTMNLSIPTHVQESALYAYSTSDVEVACQWVRSRDLSTSTLNTLLWTSNHTVHNLPHAAEARLRLTRLVLARGAEPNKMTTITERSTATVRHRSNLVCMIADYSGQSSARLIDLLISWGAGVDRSRCRVTVTRENGGKIIFQHSALASAILYQRGLSNQQARSEGWGASGQQGRFRYHRAIATALLRGGAGLNSVTKITVENDEGDELETRYASIEDVLAEKEVKEPELADDADFLALKAFLRSVRAAGGYRGFVIEQRRTCALMRHLAIRDRATTRDGFLGFLARTGERGLFRRVLSYLSPRQYHANGRPRIALNIILRPVGTANFPGLDDCTIQSTWKLFSVFRVYAARIPLPFARLAFSLPGSEVMIEGYQTAEDLGLADGSIINVMLYAEHPVGLREQAVAAAAAAAAAKQYLEHLRADERFIGAEDAEEAFARAAAAETGRRVAARE